MKTPLVILIIGAFLLNSFGPIPARADETILPKPGKMVDLSPSFNPPILKGIKVNPEDPFKFEFILDRGDDTPTRGHVPYSRDVSPSTMPSDILLSARGGSAFGGNVKATQRQKADALKSEANKLIKYFLAALTVPEQDLWVNLSPYEKNRIVPEAFGQTEMGRDLLAQDYLLKQITASLMYPEGEVGKKFWKKIYEESAKKFGNTNIPVNTFNKVWIVPEKAVVYENAKNGTAYVVESKLKVMLEEDYLAIERNLSQPGDMTLVVSPSPLPSKKALKAKATQLNPRMPNEPRSTASQIIKEIILPELTKEINEGQNFAQLRQVYNSLILATWYKRSLKGSFLDTAFVNKNKVKGVNINDPDEKNKIYERYLQSFKKGAYNLIKETEMPDGTSFPRKYFSGGMQLRFGIDALEYRDISQVPDQANGNFAMIGVNLIPGMRDSLNGYQQVYELIKSVQGKASGEIIHFIISKVISFNPQTNELSDFIVQLKKLVVPDNLLLQILEKYQSDARAKEYESYRSFEYFFYENAGLDQEATDKIKKNRPFALMADKPANGDLRYWEALLSRQRQLVDEANRGVEEGLKSSLDELRESSILKVMGKQVWSKAKESMPGSNRQKVAASETKTKDRVEGSKISWKKMAMSFSLVIALSIGLSRDVPPVLLDNGGSTGLGISEYVQKIIGPVKEWAHTQWQVTRRNVDLKNAVDNIKMMKSVEYIESTVEIMKRSPADALQEMGVLQVTKWAMNDVLIPYLVRDPSEFTIRPEDITESFRVAFKDELLVKQVLDLIKAKRVENNPQLRDSFFALREHLYKKYGIFIFGTAVDEKAYLMTYSTVGGSKIFGQELISKMGYSDKDKIHPFQVIMLNKYATEYPKPSYVGMVIPVRDIKKGEMVTPEHYYPIVFIGPIDSTAIIHEAGHVMAKVRGWDIPNTELEAILTEFIISAEMPKNIFYYQDFWRYMQEVINKAAFEDDVYGIAYRAVIQDLLVTNGHQGFPVKLNSGDILRISNDLHKIDIEKIRKRLKALYWDQGFLRSVPAGTGHLEGYEDLTGINQNNAIFRLAYEFNFHSQTIVALVGALGALGVLIYFSNLLTNSLNKNFLNKRKEKKLKASFELSKYERRVVQDFIDAILEAWAHEKDSSSYRSLDNLLRICFLGHRFSDNRFLLNMTSDLPLNQIQKVWLLYLMVLPRERLFFNDRSKQQEIVRLEFMRDLHRVLKGYKKGDSIQSLYERLIEILYYYSPHSKKITLVLKKARFFPNITKKWVLRVLAHKYGYIKFRGHFLYKHRTVQSHDSQHFIPFLYERLEAYFEKLDPDLLEKASIDQTTRLLADKTDRLPLILDLRKYKDHNGRINVEWMDQLVRVLLLFGDQLNYLYLILPNGKVLSKSVSIKEGVDNFIMKEIAPYIDTQAYDMSSYFFDPEETYPGSKIPNIPKINANSVIQFSVLSDSVVIEGNPISSIVPTVSVNSDLFSWEQQDIAGRKFRLPGNGDQVFWDPTPAIYKDQLSANRKGGIDLTAGQMNRSLSVINEGSDVIKANSDLNQMLIDEINGFTPVITAIQPQFDMKGFLDQPH